MKVVLTFLFFVFINVGLIQGQAIEQIYLNQDYTKQEKIKDFEYIDAQMDLSDIDKIADYQIQIDKSGKDNLGSVFGKLWKEASKLGANAYALNTISFQNGQYQVLLSLYYLNEEQMQENFSYYDQNIVVVFGDLNTTNEEKFKSCKVNGQKVEIAPYTYSLFKNEIGSKIKISVGGLLGSSVSIKGADSKLGSCYSLGGLSLMPSGGAVVGSGGSGMGVGINISTGNIYPMGLNFGLFVMTILDSTNNVIEE